MIKKSLLLAILILGVVASYAQKVDLDREYIKVKYTNLPTEPILDEMKGKDEKWEDVTDEEQAQWIWSEKAATSDHILFRAVHKIGNGMKSAKVFFTCDNRASLYVNGKQVSKNNLWNEPKDRCQTHLLQ